MWIIDWLFHCGLNNWSISIKIEKKKPKQGEHTTGKETDKSARSRDTESSTEIADT